jgi:peptidyl-dipeptidase Dcp
MKKTVLIALSITLGIAVHAQTAKSATAKAKQTVKKTVVKKEISMSNPLLQKSPLQYQAPQFDKIKDSDFKPAFEYGLAEHLKQIEAVANNPKAPTFENTILALETGGQNLRRAQSVFFNLTSANTNPTLQKLEEEYSPIFAAHSDKMYLNDKLYKRVKAVYDKRNELALDAESKRLVEFYEQEFEIAGANLSPEKKAELKKVNEQLATYSTLFSNKLLAARKNGALLIDDVKDLDGLSADEIAATAEDAKNAGYPGKYLLALQNTTQQPLLQSLKNRSVRERLFKAGWIRAEKGDANDTREIVEKLAALRLKKGQLLGKKNYAGSNGQNAGSCFGSIGSIGKTLCRKGKKRSG